MAGFVHFLDVWPMNFGVSAFFQVQFFAEVS